MCIGGCGSESQTALKHPPLIKNNNKGSDNFEAGIDIDVFLSADERLKGHLNPAKLGETNSILPLSLRQGNEQDSREIPSRDKEAC